MDRTRLNALVVDDDPDIVDILVRMLRYEGFDARGAGSGADALRVAEDMAPQLVVLDVMLPDLDGFEVLRRLREHQPAVGVVFLTARDAVEDRIAGITAGGDDYVTKPFSLEEVMARIRGLMRRAGMAPDGHLPARQLAVGDLVMDEEGREVLRGGEPIELTATEFELLRFLMRNARKVMSKRQILDEVWHYDYGGDAHVVELYVSYLRKKIDHGREPMLRTVRGVGYVLRPAAS